ncbi:hypothetical protein DDB_G0270514 [Dictyostelium discoideum AX4]|uniref:Uncharacterized protein n=1 Tax=Dictyostelium discoideum TaxID=44689 RepID=Q55E24_DICDI|nr:hypothetical protein DDB_G0270514 [Dictyostelium discoideum AX4]EAL72607.1 hypothetical protein DDB_G0270514 [Dictyostelium discoideum AX4]|eukprot:XP_645957.1 hypothetical protein DDB_G0270514 [Dictyostelium discoideum AX4]
MSISYKDFRYPECWKRNPNSKNQYFAEIFKDSIKVGIYELKNQKHYSYMEDIVGICRYFYPTIDNEQLTLCGTFMNCHEHILFTDQFLNSDVEPPTLCEKLTILLQNSLKQWAIKYKKLETYNITITTLIQWMYSVYPLNKISDLTDPIHMDLYTFIRKVNCGVPSSIAVVLLVDKEINEIDISKILLDPFSLGIHKSNPLYFLQINENLSYDDILKSIINKCNQRVNQKVNDEELLLKQLKEQGYTENQLNQVNLILNYIHYIIQGNIGYSICSKRYNSIDQEDKTLFEKNRSCYI